jgi:hypothetical protein
MEKRRAGVRRGRYGVLNRAGQNVMGATEFFQGVKALLKPHDEYSAARTKVVWQGLLVLAVGGGAIGAVMVGQALPGAALGLLALGSGYLLVQSTKAFLRAREQYQDGSVPLKSAMQKNHELRGYLDRLVRAPGTQRTLRRVARALLRGAPPATPKPKT